MEVKKCRGCREEKSIEEFDTWFNSKDGYRLDCKDCVHKNSYEYRLALLKQEQAETQRTLEHLSQKDLTEWTDHDMAKAYDVAVYKSLYFVVDSLNNNEVVTIDGYRFAFTRLRGGIAFARVENFEVKLFNWTLFEEGWRVDLLNPSVSTPSQSYKTWKRINHNININI